MFHQTGISAISRKWPLSNWSSLTFFILIFTFSSCKTIATYDANSFVKTAELKAKTLVLMSHGDEDFTAYRDKVDDIMILAEQLYAIQKTRELNYITVKQWDVIMKRTGASDRGMLANYFDLWKKKGKVSAPFIEESRETMGAAFDEILKLEQNKVK